jgi:hypothetical protein
MDTRRLELPVNLDGIALQEGEEYTNALFDRHYGDLCQFTHKFKDDL